MALYELRTYTLRVGAMAEAVRDEAGTIDSVPATPIAVRAFCHGRPKTRQWRSPVPQSEENVFLSVNYLTLLNRFLNDAA